MSKIISPPLSKRKACSSWGRGCCHFLPPRTISRSFFPKTRRKSWKKWRRKLDSRRTHRKWMHASRCLQTFLFQDTMVLSVYMIGTTLFKFVKIKLLFFLGTTGCRKRERAEAAAHVGTKGSTQTHWGNPCPWISGSGILLGNHRHQFVAVRPHRLTSPSCDPPPWSRCQTSNWPRSWSNRKWSPCCTTTVCTTRPIMQPVSCSAGNPEDPPPRPTMHPT